MQFDSWSAFIEMGGYGFYVWLSFGSCSVILGALWLSSVKRHKQIFTDIRQQIAREQRIKAANSAKEGQE